MIKTAREDPRQVEIRFRCTKRMEARLYCITTRMISSCSQINHRDSMSTNLVTWSVSKTWQIKSITRRIEAWVSQTRPSSTSTIYSKTRHPRITSRETLTTSGSPQATVSLVPNATATEWRTWLKWSTWRSIFLLICDKLIRETFINRDCSINRIKCRKTSSWTQILILTLDIRTRAEMEVDRWTWCMCQGALLQQQLSLQSRIMEPCSTCSIKQHQHQIM